MPRSRNAWTRLSVKCRPAVGAATEPSVAGEHGLVIGAVVLVDGAAAGDIGRQRHVAALVERLVEHRAVKRKGKSHLAPPSPLASTVASSCSRKQTRPSAAEAHDIAGFQPLRRPHQRAPARAVEPLGQRCRDRRLAIAAAAAEPAAVQVRRQNLGVVDDQGIAAAQQRRQIADGAVLALDRRARTHDQKPRGIARRRRPQRDAVLRQGKIEQVGAHGRQLGSSCPPAGLRLKGHIATFGAAINVTPSAVIQVKRGIGDVIWHLPFVRAIAAASPGGQVTFLAPPSSGAKELLAAEPSVAETLYFEHAGSELRRGLNLIRLSRCCAATVSARYGFSIAPLRPALAATLAGIPERIGLGLGPQRLFITNPGIDQSHFHDHPIDWLRALMAAMKVPLPTTEPDLPVPAATLAAIGEKFTSQPRPWIVLGIGASHPDKDWPDDHWPEFLAGCAAAAPARFF